MAEGVGQWLRRAREAQNLTLEDVEAQLRIRKRYLKALEQADYDALPGDLQIRGFLRNYARFLGLSPEEAIVRYEADLEGRPAQPPPHAVARDAHRPVLERPSVFAPIDAVAQEAPVATTRFSTGKLQMLLGLAIVSLVIALTALSISLFSHAVPATPTPTITPTPLVTESPTLPATPPPFVPAADGTVTIRLEAQIHAWVRLTADGVVVFQGIAAPGSPLVAQGKEKVLVETGSAGSFLLYVNDTPWGTLGAQDQIVRRAWTPTGETQP